MSTTILCTAIYSECFYKYFTLMFLCSLVIKIYSYAKYCILIKSQFYLGN